MNQTDLSPVHVFTILASSFFSISVASVVGPYLVIALGGMGGAAIALLFGETRGRLKAFLFFFGSTSISVLLTVPLSMVMTRYLDSIPEHWLFAPTAFALGYSGDKWPDIFRWLGSKLNAIIDGLIKLRTGKPNE